MEDVFTTSQTFDDDTRLTGKTHVTEAGETLAYSYEYEGTIITKITSPNGVTTFGYDDTDQLTSANSDFQANQSYNYDATGNRQGDKIGSHNRLESDGVYTYEYDDEGNRISRMEIATGVVTTYVWDWRNRLVEVSQSDELGEVFSRSEYEYDAFDRRLGKSVDGDGDGIYELVEDFVYHGDSIYLVLTGDEISQRYFYGPGTDLVLAEETAGEGVEYALTNHLNSVEFILDSAGKVINEIVYDSFGSIVSETHPGVNVRYGFTGRDFDKETGLGFYRTRYYDFVTRRFVSQDRLGFAAGDVNLYRYVGNTPTVYVDPSGMIVETIWDVASVLLGVASFAYNIYQGVRNRQRSYFVDAGLDLVGIAADIGAVLLPGAPAVGAATIRAGRFALKAETAIEIAQVANVGVNAYQGFVSTQESVRAFRDGDYAGGIGHGIGATLSFGGAATSILGSAPGSAGNLLRKGFNAFDDFGGGFGSFGKLATATESLGTTVKIDADEGDGFFQHFFASIADGNGSEEGSFPSKIGDFIPTGVLDAGGFGTILTLDDPNLVLKIATQSRGKANAQLVDEAANLKLLAERGLPTPFVRFVEAVDSNGDVLQAILLKRVDGVLSKKILQTGKFQNITPSAADLSLVNQKTIQELEQVKNIAAESGLVIDDLQFIVDKSGSISLIDPARITDISKSRGKKAKTLKKNFLSRIDKIIHELKEIARENAN